MASSNGTTTSCGRAIAPEIATPVPASEMPFSRATASRRAAIGGTSGRKVAGCFFVTSSTMSASKRGNSTRRAPIDIAKVRHRVSPYAWNIGSTA